MSEHEPKTKFYGVSVTAEARDALREVTTKLTSPAGRRISMSDALIALIQQADLDAVASALRDRAERSADG